MTCQVRYNRAEQGSYEKRELESRICAVEEDMRGAMGESGLARDETERLSNSCHVPCGNEDQRCSSRRCFSTPLSSTAFVATVIELALMASAPTAGLSRIPSGYRTPAATGIA